MESGAEPVDAAVHRESSSSPGNGAAKWERLRPTEVSWRDLRVPSWRRMLLLTGVVSFLVLLSLAHAAGQTSDSPDVFDLTESLSPVTKLVVYGLFALGLCLLSRFVPDAPLLAYLFSMSIAQFAGLRVALALLQCAIVLLRTGAPRNLVPSGTLLLFLLCITASGTWALDPHESFADGLSGIGTMLLQIPLTLATLGLLRSKLTTINRLFMALVLGAVPGCIWTFRNALAGIRYLGDQAEYYTGFIPPDTFSTILVMSGIFLMFCLTSAEVSARSKCLAGLALPVVCLALLLTGIRSGWLGFGMATLLLLARTRSMLAWGGVLMAFVLVGFLGLSAAVGLNLSEKMASRLTGDSGESRLELWQVAAQGFAKRPVLGIGWGCFPTYAADSTTGNRWATHNIFMRVLCELGSVGFAIFFAWIIGTAVRVRHCTVGSMVPALMLGVLVQGLLLDLFIGTQFWMFLGLCEGVRAGQPLWTGERAEAPSARPTVQATPLRT